MSTTTSESELSALEKSKVPAKELLDRAAAIIGLIASSEFPAYALKPTSNSNFDTQRFRHQWLLRWLLKQLETHVTITSGPISSSEDLICDPRTWGLLFILIRDLPAGIARAILVEKNFCDSLAPCLEKLRTIWSTDPSTDGYVDSIACNHIRQGDGGKLAASISHVLGSLAQVFEGIDEDAHENRSSNTLRWVGSQESAMTVIAQVVEFSSVILRSPVRQNYEEVINSSDSFSASKQTSIFHSWLRLWLRTNSVLPRKSKNDPDLFFNETLLGPMIRSLNYIPAHENDLVAEIERLVAVHAILPTRKAFLAMVLKQTATTKVSNEGQIGEQLEAIVKPWGKAVHELSIHTSGSHIYRIASRLIPRTNLLLRRKETPWLDALWLCLTYIASYESINGNSLDVNKQSVSFSPAKGRDLASRTAQNPPVDLLNALKSSGIKPSSEYWEYFVFNCLRHNDVVIPVGLLASLVDINPSTFTRSSIDNNPSFLEPIFEYSHRLRQATSHELEVYIADCLVPVLYECGRSKQLDRFCELWLQRLTPTYRVKQSSTVSRYEHLFQTPKLLSAYEEVCGLYTPTFLCKKLATELPSSLPKVSEKSASDTAALGVCTLIIPMLAVLSTDLVIKDFMVQKSQSLVITVRNCLVNASVPAEHKWILAKLHAALQLAGAQFPIDEDLRREYQSACYRIDSEAESQPSKLLYAYWAFHAASLHLNPSSTDPEPNLFSEFLRSISKAAERFVRSADGQDVSAWDGSIQDMDSQRKLLSACIARLISLSCTWIRLYSDESRTLARLCVALQCLYSPAVGADGYGPGTFLDLCQALIRQYMSVNRANYMDLFLDTLSTFKIAKLVRYLPFELMGAISSLTDKHQIHELLKILTRNVPSAPVFKAQSDILTDLAMLDEILQNESVIIATKDLALISAMYSQFDASIGETVSLDVVVQLGQIIVRLTQNLVRRLRQAKASDLILSLIDLARSEFKSLKTQREDKTSRLATYRAWIAVSIAGSSELASAATADDSLAKAHSKLLGDFQKQIDRSVRLLEDPSCQTRDVAEVNFVVNATYKCGLRVDLPRPWKDAAETQRVLQSLLTGQTFEVAKASLHLPRDASDYESVDILKSRATAQIELRTLSASIRDMSMDDKQDTLDSMKLCDSDTKDTESFWMLVAVIVRSLHTGELGKHPRMLKHLAYFASLQHIQRTTTMTCLILRLEISKMILESHSGILNQDITDRLLSSIAALSTSGSLLAVKGHSKKHKPQEIFDRLCALLQTILVRYRRRLSDRHHLLLPALQALLRCLFFPSSLDKIAANHTDSVSKSMFLASIPKWLNDPTQNQFVTISPRSAAKFSRLLQNLADPSASAARNVMQRNKRNATPGQNLNLVDETKELKREVSLHTQYLLQTFCQASLDGHISPDVREKLMPGLYAIIAATDIEVLRGLNAAMDENQRAIWKDLYADWTRFGKWNQQ